MTAAPRSSVETARALSRIEHPSIPMTTLLDGQIVVEPAAGIAADAQRVGFLSDMPMGSSLAEYLDPIILGFEDAISEGRLLSTVEIIPMHVVGLPTGQAENVTAAYKDLVARGCSLVLSTGVTNNALVLRDVINDAKVPYITMAGTTLYTGEYCFSLANGGHGEEAAILAGYLSDRGYRHVVVTGEDSPGDAEYRASFAEQAGLYALEILASHYFAGEPSHQEVDATLTLFRDLEPDALVYCGFGFHSRQLNPSWRVSAGIRRRR
jgi:branched-chain amino acid transport system substrate-binding protein